MVEVTLSKNRIRKIEQAATYFTQGQYSLQKAQRFAKSQNLFAAANSLYKHLGDSAYKTSKQQLIDKTFQTQLHLFQLKKVRDAVPELEKILPDNRLAESIPNTQLQQFFADLHFENKHEQVKIDNIEHDKTTRKLTINLNVQNKENCNNQSVTSNANLRPPAQKDSLELDKPIVINNITPEQANLIRVEYAIFKHMQFGEPLEDNQHIIGLGIVKSPNNSADATSPQAPLNNKTQFFQFNTLTSNPTDANNVLLLNKLNKYYSMHKKVIYDKINFAGGGAKGISYVGILAALGDFRLRLVTAVSGASAGAITASLVGCGIKVNEFRDFALTTNLKITQDELVDTLNTKILETVKKRLTEYKTVPNQKISNEQRIVINKYKGYKEDKLTFKHLHELKEKFPNLGFKDIFINATLANSNRIVEVELNYKTSPDLEIAEAAAASAALPIWFKPREATGKLKAEYMQELGLHSTNKLFLRDGGLVTNIPNSYLLASKKAQEGASSTPNILNLAFKDNEILANKKDLSMSHRIKDILVWMPCYVFRTFDITAIMHYNQQIHYIDTKVNEEEITTTDFNKAMKKLILLCDQTNKSFRESELEKLKNEVANPPEQLTDNDLARLKKLKFEIYPDFFYGDHLTKRVLKSIPKNETGTFFELLNQTKNYEDFVRIYEMYKVALQEAKTERLKGMVSVAMWRAV